MNHVETFNHYRPYITDLLCVGALTISSNHSFQKYIISTSLAPSPEEGLIPTPAPKVKTETAGPPRRWYQKLFSRKTAKFIGIMLMVWAIQAGIAFGLPRISTRFFLDCLWITVLFGMHWLNSAIALRILLPSTQTATLKRSKPTSGLAVSYTTIPEHQIYDKLRGYAGAIFSVALIASTYFGVTVLQPLGVAAWIANLIGSSYFPKATIKTVVKVLFCFELATITLSALMIWLIPSTPGKNPMIGENGATPSDWVLSLMMLMSQAWPTLFVGHLICMTMRFDHHVVYPHDAPRLHGGSTSVTFPLDKSSSATAKFAKPLYTAGLLGLVASQMALRMIPCSWFRTADSSQDGRTIFGMLLVLPAVVSAIGARAWSKGLLREWWNYRESWELASDPVANEGADEMDDVEKVLARNEEEDQVEETAMNKNA